MTRRVSKHGTTYAKGSTSSYGGWEPKECAYGTDCVHGGRIVKSHEPALWFYFDDLTSRKFSFHDECRQLFGLTRLGLAATPPVGMSRAELLASQIQECLEVARAAIERDDPPAVYEQIRNIGWVLLAHAETPRDTTTVGS